MDTTGQEQAPAWATVLLNRIQALETTTQALQARLDIGESHRRDRLPDVPTFEGTRKEYLSWITQLRAKLDVDMGHDKEITRFWYSHSRLRGKALLQVSPWVAMATTNGMAKLTGLIDQLDAAYNTREEVEDGEKQLWNLQQKSRPFVVFFAEFERLLIAANGITWPDRVKRMFLEAGFSKELRIALIPVEKPENFESYIAIVRRVAMELERGRGTSLSYDNGILPGDNGMDWEVAPEVRVAALGAESKGLRAKRVSKDVLEARRANGLCLRCGNTGHRIRDCSYLPPVKVNASRLFLPELDDNDDE